MEVYTFVLWCALVATVAAFTIPDQVTEYDRRDDLMNIVSSQAACKCKNGRCVTDNRGKTKCNCPPRYALQDEFTCERCDCGKLGRCMFIAHPQSSGGTLYQKKCLCDVGSAEKDGLCINCHCGENSKCEFEGEEKVCYCIEGYSEKDGVCTKCDCGYYGECKFEHGQKQCTCDEGYLVHDGYCKECNCGEFGGCNLDSRGEKVCSCNDGFSDNRGVCEKCDCGQLSVGCGFRGDGAKNCTCMANRAQLGDYCVDCNCGTQSSGCIFSGGQKSCHCFQGYVQKEDDTCRVKCSAAHPCKNGAECIGGICRCLPGTSGEFCDIVNDCESLCPQRPGIECAFNPRKLKRFCKCTDKSLGFYEETRECKPTCNDENAICRNGGQCIGKPESDYSRFCHCLEGTEGDYCEEIPVCYEKDCGYQAVCSYDVARKTAFCKCQDSRLSFDPEDRTCKNICYEDKDCENGGKCVGTGEDPNSNFCRCLDGTKGDHCEKVPGCEAKECGPNAKCVYDIPKRMAVCECDDPNYAFDPMEYKCRRTCRDTSDCKNGGECSGDNTSRFCRCLDGTDDDFCEKVIGCEVTNCGHEARCTFDVATKSAICVCNEEKLDYDPDSNSCKRSCEDLRQCQNGGACISRGRHHFCDCLPGTSGDLCEIVDECVKVVDKCKGGSRCAFDVEMEKAICDCANTNEKYDPLEGKCKNTCDQDAVCKNGGLCMHRGDYLFCHCKDGTSGTFCEIVDDCVRGVCGGLDTVCSFDVQSENVRCGCKDPNALYDADKKRCIACDCGRNAVSCRFEQGKKVCNCKEGYEAENGICKKKFCTEKKCTNGRCEVVDEQEVCSCYEGFVLEGDYCKRLNCSRIPCFNGTCIVRHDNREQCICPSGYTLQGGICIRGVCRIDTCFGGRCKKIDGELMCVCPERYNLEGIGCFETVCKIQHCFGGKCVVKDDEEICTCPDNHVLVGNVCKRILCEKKNCFGGQCNVVNGEEVCTCPPGFFLVQDVCREIQRKRQ